MEVSVAYQNLLPIKVYWVPCGFGFGGSFGLGGRFGFGGRFGLGGGFDLNDVSGLSALELFKATSFASPNMKPLPQNENKIHKQKFDFHLFIQ